MMYNRRYTPERISELKKTRYLYLVVAAQEDIWKGLPHTR